MWLRKIQQPYGQYMNCKTQFHFKDVKRWQSILIKCSINLIDIGPHWVILIICMDRIHCKKEFWGRRKDTLINVWNALMARTGKDNFKKRVNEDRVAGGTQTKQRKRCWEWNKQIVLKCYLQIPIAFIKMEMLVTLSDILLSGGDRSHIKVGWGWADEKMKSVGEDTFFRSWSVKGRRETQE